MSEFNRLMARDGHQFDAWLAPAVGTPRGALVVLQEIFGVTAHIRDVVDILAQTHDFVILDTPGTFNEIVASAIEVASATPLPAPFSSPPPLPG